MTEEKLISVGELVPSIGSVFDQTDKVCALIPEELLDWRPTDPSNRFSFSLAELAIHLGDSRRNFARALSGDASLEGYLGSFVADSPDGNPWRFKTVNKAEILENLAPGRSEIEAWLVKPISVLLYPTEGTRERFAKRLEKLRSERKETKDLEQRGPVTLIQALMLTATHESGHRGSLQTLLRQHGVNLPN